MSRQVVQRSRIDIPDALWTQLKREAAWLYISPGTYASLLLCGLLERPDGPLDLSEQAIRRWEQLAKVAAGTASHARRQKLLAAAPTR